MTALPARAASRPQRRGRRFALGALLIAAFLAFVALGTWQVERRTWKLALIERVARRVDAPALPAPGPDTWGHISRVADEYRHVRVTGRLLTGSQTRVQAVTRFGAGFWVLTPLRLTDGSTVLVNRGFVAAETPPPGSAETAGDTSTTVTGLLRITEPRGGFLRTNDPAGDRWYSRDVAAIARARGLERVAPYFIDADAAPETSTRRPEEPIGGLTVVQFSNSHLLYAVTWYTLALLSAVGGWQLLREGHDAAQQRAEDVARR